MASNKDVASPSQAVTCMTFIARRALSKLRASSDSPSLGLSKTMLL